MPETHLPAPHAPALVHEKNSKKRAVSGRPNGEQFTPLQKSEMKARLAALHARRIPLYKIALDLGVSQSTVVRWVKEIDLEWRAATVRDIDGLKARELWEIDQLQRTAWQAFEESRGVIQKKRTEFEVVTDADGRRSPATKKAVQDEHTSPGDPRFLEIVQRCGERREKLMMLHGPTTHIVGGTIQHVVAGKTEAERMEQYDALFTLDPHPPVDDAGGVGPAAALAAGDGHAQPLDTD